MQDIFGELLDIFVVIYLDDILFFSNNIEVHCYKIREVLQRLKNHALYVKVFICEFHRTSVEFLGFANFYHQFIKDYSNITIPLKTLTRKDQQFQWNLQDNNAFDKFQTLFCEASILLHFDFQ